MGKDSDELYSKILEKLSEMENNNKENFNNYIKIEEHKLNVSSNNIEEAKKIKNNVNKGVKNVIKENVQNEISRLEECKMKDYKKTRHLLRATIVIQIILLSILVYLLYAKISNSSFVLPGFSSNRIQNSVIKSNNTNDKYNNINKENNLVEETKNDAETDNEEEIDGDLVKIEYDEN